MTGSTNAKEIEKRLLWEVGYHFKRQQPVLIHKGQSGARP